MEPTAVDSQSFPAVSVSNPGIPQASVAHMEVFYDVRFNVSVKAYAVVCLKSDLQRWQDPESVASCALQDEYIRGGDLVEVRLQDNQRFAKKKYAKVREIRTLPDLGTHSLLRIAWLYHKGGRCHRLFR